MGRSHKHWRGKGHEMANGAVPPVDEGPAMSALATDGPAMSALATDGPAMSALATDGPAMDGLGTDGLGTDGLGTDGLGTDGLGTDGPAVEVAPAMAAATVMEAEAAVRAPDEGRVYGYSSTEYAPPQSIVDVPEYPDFAYLHGAPRRPIRDIRWASTLRRFGRAMVWALPAGVVALSLASVWGWPTRTSESSGASPGTWLVVTAVGFALWLIGLNAVAALLATTPGRIWAAASVVGATLGAALLLPAVGVAGLARPAVRRTAESIGVDATANLHAALLDGTVGHWLVTGGGVLLGVSALALAGAVLGSDVFSRLDGWFVFIGVAVSFVAAFLSWEFLFTVAGMALLAATLGVAWNASRLTADGRVRDAD